MVSGNGPLMFPRLLDVVAFSLWGSGFFIAADVSAGKKSGTSEHTLIFANKTAGRGCPQLGSGRQVSVFHRTSGLGAHLALSMSPHPLKKFLKQP